VNVLFAHGSQGAAHGLLTTALQQWPWEPVTLVLLLVSLAVYVRGVRALWRRAGPGGGIARWEAAAFIVGLLSLACALLSPLTWLSSILFSAHMTQHEMLMLVSAPLLVFGKPLLAFLWSFPSARRESLGGWARAPRVRQAWRASTGPLFVFLLHAAALWVWHAPVLYEAALRSSLVHALQHLIFVATAALFWWGMVHGRYGRMGYGVGVLYVFLTALHSSILGALMAVAPGVWYSSHAQAARAWGFDALLDQQLAGLLMWVPSGVVFIVFGLALLAAWLGESERRARLGSMSAG
jgi:cytochrome c oxidase assembly factor CtaG